MRYLFLILVTTALISAVKAKVPDYIKTCKRNDPQISKCVENTINSLRDRLTEGIPELDVPSIEPMYFEKLNLDFGPGFQAVTRDLKLKGIKNFLINDLIVNLSTDTISFNISIPEIIATGTYEVDATIGAIPIRGKGPINLTAKSINGHGTFQGKKIKRGGKTLFYFPSMKLELQIGNYQVQLKNLFDGDTTIQEVTNKLLNDEQTEVLASVIPGIEKVVIEKALLVANNVFKRFTWDELFPES